MDVREEEKSSTTFSETENKDETSTPFRETENKDETKEKGLALCEKEKGNDFYKHGEYEKAIEAYTQGMLYDPTDALLPANRAMAYLKLKRYVKCEEDCTLSLSIDPFHVKSYLRRATARFHLGRLTEAGEDYKLVLDIDPKNEQAMTELKKIEQYQQDPLQQMTEDYNRRRGYRTVDIQILQEGLEADDYLSKCTKNPGHVNFIPVEKFTLDKLPADYRDDELFQLIKAAADLTIRIGVEVVNPDRPEFWPYTQDPYPCYAQRGKKCRRCGTGFVLKVVKYSGCRGIEVASGVEEEDDIDYSTCPCKKCKSSVSPSSEWYEVYVLTGAHVLFGDAEGFDCSCRIFYDAKDSPVKLLDAGTWTRTDVFVDSFLMTRVTCDAQLGEKISDMYKRFRRLWGVVGDRYAKKPDDRFVFIASHPHGGPKRVSYGTILETMGAGEQEGLDLSIWGYTTNTCPGSSGASVFGLHLGGVFVHNGTYKDMFNFATGYHVKK